MITIMFGNAREPVAGRTEEFCEQQGLWILSSCTHRHRMESPNESSAWLPTSSMPCLATRTSRHASGLIRSMETFQDANEGERGDNAV